MSSMSRAKSGHIPALDGIRGVAVLLVFLSHTSEKPLVPGGFGVTVFFFLSGYLITTLLRKEAETTGTISMSSFYVRRAFRILPPMYLTLAAAWAIARFGHLPTRGNGLGLLSATFYFFNYADLTHLHALVPTGMNLLWSLMVEEHFYLIFPWVYAAFLRKGLKKADQVRLLLASCGVALLWRCILVFGFHTPVDIFPRWTYSASDARFDAIMFGCILAIASNPFFDDPSPFLKRWKGYFAVGGLATIVLSLIIREPHYRETLRYSAQSIALYPIFYFCISTPSARSVSWLNLMPVRWLGWISYSAYLIQSSLIILGWKLFPEHHLAVGFAAAALTILYATGVRFAVEEPLRKFRNTLERNSRSRKLIQVT